VTLSAERPPNGWSYWSDDPVLDILNAIEVPSIRVTAYRLFAEEKIQELEALLTTQGILSAEGDLDIDRFGVERIDEIETEDEEIATLIHDYGYNTLVARRRGWMIEYVLRLGGPETVDCTSTVPHSDEVVAAILSDTGLEEYLEETATDDDESEEWTITNEVHSGIDALSGDEEEESPP